MTNPEERRLQPGSRIRVVNPDSLHFGRTGRVEALASYVGGAGGAYGGPPASRGWRVLFDWPLGGLASRAILREHELEVILGL